MDPRPLLVGLALVALAGCMDTPAVPDGAVEATDPTVPGLRLHAWAEPTAGGSLLRAVLRNDGGLAVQYRTECGHPWQSGVHAPNGTPVRLYVKDLCSDYFYDFLQPGQGIDFRHSWDHADHPGDGPAGSPVAPGAYVWRLRVETLGGHVAELTTEVPLVVPVDGWASGRDGAGLVVYARVEPQGQGHRLLAFAVNEGPTPVPHPELCDAEWTERIVTPGGGAFPGRPGGTCAAIRQGVLEPNGTVAWTVDWEGRVPDPDTGERHPAPPGQYRWTVGFRVGEPGAERVVEAVVPFTV